MRATRGNNAQVGRIKNLVLLVVCALSVLLACSGAPSGYSSISGTVVAISDGDTVTIADDQRTQHKIRLQGIDAPEKSQPFSQLSKQHLSQWVFGKQVTVSFDPANKYDRWGRILGKILVNGADANLEQIKAGLAWHYKRYEYQQSLTDRQAYAEAEIAARANRRELWQEPNPTAPWLFRHHTTGSSDDSEKAAEDFSPEPTPSSLHHAPTQTELRTLTSEGAAEIRGNKRTKIYHWPGCPNYDDIAIHNRVPFKTREEAEKAGFRAARNCN
jgi:endonuclease YncB( thermonuclease family)